MKNISKEQEAEVKEQFSDITLVFHTLGHLNPVLGIEDLDSGSPAPQALWLGNAPTGPVENAENDDGPQPDDPDLDEFIAGLHKIQDDIAYHRQGYIDRVLAKLQWRPAECREIAHAIAYGNSLAAIQQLCALGYGPVDAERWVRELFDWAQHEVPLNDANDANEVEDLSEEDVAEEPLPEFAGTITGSIADYARAIEPDFPLEFKIASVLTRVGLALSGKTHLDGAENLQPRFFMELIAEPNTGKTGSIETTDGLDEHVLFYHTLFSVDSGPALLDNFVAESARQRRDNVSDGSGPSRLLLSVDEIKHLFEIAGGSDGKGSNVLTHVLRLYENNKTGNATRQHGSQQISNAHLGILGGATPKGHEEMWIGTSGSKNGLQSRFCLVGTNATSLPTHRRKTDVAAAEKALDRLRYQLEQPPAVLHMTPEAAEMLTGWAEQIAPNEHSTRLPDIVKRVAMVLAITNDTDVIEANLMAQAIAFSNHVLAARERYNPADAANNEQAFENRILAALRKRKDASKRTVFRLISPEKYRGGYKACEDAWGALARAEKIEVSRKVGRKVFWHIAI